MSDSEFRPRRQTSNAVVILAAAAICLPILTISLFAALARTDDIDAFLYAYYAKRMLAGQRLYADLWDNKPPGVFWADVLGLLLSGGRFFGIAIVCSAAAVGSGVMFFLTARRLYGVRVAAIGVVMAALYVFLHDYHVGSNRPNTFYVFFELCVMALYVHAVATQDRRLRLFFMAGLCAVAAVMCHQTAFSAAATIAVHQVYLTLSGSQKTRDLLRHAVSLGAGYIAGAIAVVIVLWSTSDLSYAWHGIVTSNLGYFVRPGKSDLLPEMFQWEDHLRVLGLPFILAAGALIHAVGSRLKEPDKSEPRPSGSGSFREFDAVSLDALGTSEFEPIKTGSVAGESAPGAFTLVVTWLPIAVYLALVGPSKRMMYFGVALAPLVLLATHGVWLLMREGGNGPRPRFSVVVAVLWFAFMMVPGVRHQWDGAQTAYVQRFDDRSVPRHQFIVETIHRYTKPDDPIYMWGYLPAAYWYADRPLAQRYIVTTLIDQWLDRAQPYVGSVMADLRRDPPKAIVMDRGELRTIEAPPENHPIRYGDFGRWLREHYFVPDDCKGKDVWIRKDRGGESGQEDVRGAARLTEPRR